MNNFAHHSPILTKCVVSWPNTTVWYIITAARSVKDARNQCHRRFASYARELLDDSTSSNVVPTFDAERAYLLFSEVYQSDSRKFVQPDWLPSPPTPEVEMDCSPFSVSEVTRAIKRMKLLQDRVCDVQEMPRSDPCPD